MRIVILFLIINLPNLSYAQIKNVFEIRSQDTLEFKGNIIKIPPKKSLNCDYLVELDTYHLIESFETDRAVAGLELYGYALKDTSPEFHLMLTTNSTDQLYNLNHMVNYMLIRTPENLKEVINIEFRIR